MSSNYDDDPDDEIPVCLRPIVKNFFTAEQRKRLGDQCMPPVAPESGEIIAEPFERKQSLPTSQLSEFEPHYQKKSSLDLSSPCSNEGLEPTGLEGSKSSRRLVGLTAVVAAVLAWFLADYTEPWNPPDADHPVISAALEATHDRMAFLRSSETTSTPYKVLLAGMPSTEWGSAVEKHIRTHVPASLNLSFVSSEQWYGFSDIDLIVVASGTSLLHGLEVSSTPSYQQNST